MTDELTRFQQGVRTDTQAVAREVTAKFVARNDSEYTVPMETMESLHQAGLKKLCIDRGLAAMGRAC